MSKEQIKQAIKRTLENAPYKMDVKKLSLFGSYLNGIPREDSDVDILVEFVPQARIGFFKMYDVQRNIEQALNKKVDIVTANQLSKYFRASVLKQAEVIYER